jgi:hypothetical protein
MSWTFICDRTGRCEAGLRARNAVPRINVMRHGRSPEDAGKSAAREFLAANPRYLQVEMTVDEDDISS